MSAPKSANDQTDDKRTALIVGATGAVGRHVLRELLASPQYTRVAEVGRRATPLSELEAALPNAGVKDKLEQRTVDFEKIAEAGLKEGKWDDVYITCVLWSLLRWSCVTELLCRCVDPLGSSGADDVARGSGALMQDMAPCSRTG